MHKCEEDGIKSEGDRGRRDPRKSVWSLDGHSELGLGRKTLKEIKEEERVGRSRERERERGREGAAASCHQTG